jgi:hypothetical protein
MFAVAERAAPDPTPIRPAANDGRAHDELADKRMPTRLERVDDREEVELLDALRKRAGPTSENISGSSPDSGQVHHMSHWGLKEGKESSAQGGVRSTQTVQLCRNGARIGPVACFCSRQRTRHEKMQSALVLGPTLHLIAYS